MSLMCTHVKMIHLSELTWSFFYPVKILCNGTGYLNVWFVMEIKSTASALWIHDCCLIWIYVHSMDFKLHVGRDRTFVMSNVLYHIGCGDSNDAVTSLCECYRPTMLYKMFDDGKCLIVCACLFNAIDRKQCILILVTKA